ncbi:hypothetical protein BC940DRAFT_345348 [Gongronella butleri]|nr:hypothetical protein BC940DRAFT_345348 [Gongronella butleri]
MTQPMPPHTALPTPLSASHYLRLQKNLLCTQDDDDDEQQRLDRISGMLCTLIHEAHAAILHQPVLDDVTADPLDADMATPRASEADDDEDLHEKAFFDPRTVAAAVASLPTPRHSFTSASPAPDPPGKPRKRSRLPRPKPIAKKKDETPYPSVSASLVVPMDTSNERNACKPRRLSTSSTWSLSSGSSSTASLLSDGLFSPTEDDHLTHASAESPPCFRRHVAASPTTDDDPILSSIERLDTSLALVDSLYRDLANRRQIHGQPLPKDVTNLPPSLPLSLSSSASSSISSSSDHSSSLAQPMAPSDAFSLVSPPPSGKAAASGPGWMSISILVALFGFIVYSFLPNAW